MANGDGDPKVTLSVNHVVMTIFVGLLMWATSLIWAKADGAASKQDLRTIEERTVGLELDRALMKRDLLLVQDDITETKQDVKDIKTILERRFGTAHDPAPPGR